MKNFSFKTLAGGGLTRIIIISLFATLACAGIIKAATTIGTNISTGGTLDVTGASTLTGNTNIVGSLTSSGANTLYGATSIGGALTATSTLNVTGQAVFSSNVGIGTTSPYAKLSVVGETVSSYFTATSTTATSTFAGGFNVGSGRFVSDFSSGNTWLGSGNFGIGTTSPAQKLDIKGNIGLGPVLNPGVAYGNVGGPNATIPTATINPTAGNLNGTYSYHMTFVTASGETEGGQNYSTVSPVNQQVDLTNIVVSSDPAVTARRIYRTTSDGNLTKAQLLTTINDNITTTYTDNIADGSLGATYEPTTNTTGGVIYLGSNKIGATNYLSTSWGINALNTNTGYYNVAMGTRALLLNTKGYSNTAIGTESMRSNTTGYGNISMGVDSLWNNTTGESNVGIGNTTLRNNQSGSFNTAVGRSAGFGSGSNSFSYNSLFGYRAGTALTTGSNNVLMGYQAGDNLTTGANNIIIGYDIDAPLVTSANTLNIGNLIFGTGVDGTGTTLSTGNVGVGTSTPSSKFTVNNGSTATTTVEFGDQYSSNSKTCFNAKNTAGGNVSFYFIGTTMVVENNRCN